MLRPSILEYYHGQSVKQLVRTRTDIKLWPSECSITRAFSLYLAIATVADTGGLQWFQVKPL